MKQKVLKRTASVLTALAMVLALSMTLFAFALEDGAYLVSRTTSYANPETGKTVDGGTNIALGDSMCASIVDDNVLVEKVGNKYYVTLGLGLMSNIKNVRIQVQTANGSYKNVPITKTGSCQRDDDTCNHYRFQMEDPSKLISPIFYVDPMGRDVQFFVKLNMGSARKGTGNFKAEMVKSSAGTSPKAETKTVKAAASTPKATAKAANTYKVTTVQAEEDSVPSGNYSADTKDGLQKLLRIVIFGIVAVAALIVLIFVLRSFLKRR